MNIIFFLSRICIIAYTMLNPVEDSIFKAHEYFVSTTQVEYISEKNSIQITIRIFTDDIEEVIAKGSNLVLDPDSDSIQINKKINQYIIEKFKILVNDKPVVQDFIGKEYKNDLVQAYFEIKLVEKIKKISFENNILLEHLPGQQNIIYFKKNEFKKSFLLDMNNTKANILLD